MSTKFTRFAAHARLALAGVATLALAACSASGTGATPTSGSSAPTESKTLTVVTHDSFNVSEALLTKFKSETGYEVKFVAPGDAGVVVNQLILSKDSPLGDVVFGVDNTFAGRVIKAGVTVSYDSPKLPANAANLKADDKGLLTPIDFGDVCLNVDHEWFTSHKVAEPVTLDDLTKPAYKNLLVVENAASSSPGLAFLIATVGAKGEQGYLDYWKALKANGVKVVKGWTEAYTVDFSGSSGKGARPIVVSYSTSPSAEIPKGSTKSRTGALLQTCFRQVEYAAVIKGAKNEVGARKFIDFMLSDTVQADIPGQMYMYPVNRAIALPKEWQTNAPLSPNPIKVDPTTIGDRREAWISAWTAVVIG